MNTDHAWKKEQQYAPMLDSRQRSALLRTGFFMSGIVDVAPQRRVSSGMKNYYHKRMHLDVFLN